MADENEFMSDREKLAVQVENDHVYLYSKCCGCGDAMTDLDTIKGLFAELGVFLAQQ